MTIGIVGLGYVGLPLAVAFAEAGERVIGVDTSVAKVASGEVTERVVDGPVVVPGC